MLKAAVRNGDRTTTRGMVIAFSSTIIDGGTQIALCGDGATCGNCNGVHRILGTGQGMFEETRPVVLEGDLVLCPCGNNRAIAGKNPGIFIEAGRALPNVEDVSAASTVNAVRSASGRYDEQVHALVVGATLEGYPFVIETPDGQLVAGRAEAGGTLPRIETGASSGFYTVHWGDEALARCEGT
ncbi:PAAR domain-containing protein [Paraburkholderia sp. BL25I1N1]|uniref:PAAR domain-containing protein n=1 Tax=Paraburkholderia sp. BL25I1N1 TaxID=1938804 RepID=UPI000D4F54DA|nr:PAAR domain-containing protein [Paraburkholderia sp. BL25I1N1]PRY01139.1 PAAR motif-containing protein [Paraburkholderia sp. BL25I1N1]